MHIILISTDQYLTNFASLKVSSHMNLILINFVIGMKFMILYKTLLILLYEFYDFIIGKPESIKEFISKHHCSLVGLLATPALNRNKTWSVTKNFLWRLKIKIQETYISINSAREAKR